MILRIAARAALLAIAAIPVASAVTAAAAPAAPSVLGAPLLGDATLDLRFTRLRSDQGSLLVCVTADPAYFPDCSKDPDKRFLTVSAKRPELRIAGLRSARYAVSVHHDENGNDKLDTFAGIPREGIGFSRNPSIGFGPPKFERVALMLGPGTTAQDVRMRYFL